MAGPAPDAPFVYSPSMSMPGGGPRYATDQPGTAANEPGRAAAASDRAAGRSVDGEELLRQTRREIGSLVREVAEMARQPIAPTRFFAALLDRTCCALAAEGAVLWRRDPATPNQLRPLHRTGRLTDRQIAIADRPAHQAMLTEVLASGNPVVVPAAPAELTDTWATTETCGTAGAGAAASPTNTFPWESASSSESAPPAERVQPANPTAHPAAVVPLIDPLAESPQYLLEVFLEPAGGVATQRGYLRFAAQMADLAGDFLRLEELRQGRRLAAAQARLAAALPRLARHQRLTACGEAITDVAAELFEVARVSLIRLPSRGDRQRGQLIAISHVASPERRGAACRALVELAASIPLPEQRATDMAADWSIWLAADPPPDGGDRQDDAPLVPLALVSFGPRDRYRLFFQGAIGERLGSEQRGLLDNFVVAAGEALWAAERWEAVPLARLWVSAGGGPLNPNGELDGSWVRRGMLVTALAATVMLAALLPTPMQVVLPAQLRPQAVRIHYAPGPGLVQRVEVEHGQRVSAGQALLVLQDLELEQQTSQLIGRRAVVGQQLARVTASLITAPLAAVPAAAAHDQLPGSDEWLIQQQRALEEEQRGIDQQLAILDGLQQRLVLRADRDGWVDAWKTEQLALGRPVQTGEPLMRVQPLETAWVADVRIPQNRRQMVLGQLVDGRRPVELRIGDGDGPAAIADFNRQLGMQPSAIGDGSDTVVELLIRGDQWDWTNGMPAEATVDCGRMPLAKVLFFDFIRSIRLQWARWT